MQVILTGTTCGAACWIAQEDVCRCSCGGANHGCLRSADGVQPVRTSKIDGFMYELHAVGKSLWKEAQQINKDAGPRHIEGSGYAFRWTETSKGAPARLKAASKAQVEKWPELAAWRDIPHWQRRCYLLWVRKT